MSSNAYWRTREFNHLHNHHCPRARWAYISASGRACSINNDASYREPGILPSGITFACWCCCSGPFWIFLSIPCWRCTRPANPVIRDEHEHQQGAAVQSSYPSYQLNVEQRATAAARAGSRCLCGHAWPPNRDPRCVFPCESLHCYIPQWCWVSGDPPCTLPWHFVAV